MISSEDQFKAIDFDPVKFTNEIHPRIKVRPMYFELGFSPSARIYGRHIVLEKLITALDILPKYYGFVIWDVYRPRAVQAKLFNWMRDEIRKLKPALTDAENFEEARKYMSPPSKVGETYCPPHLSGGAIDLTLCDVDGNELNMGTIFDDCTERAHANFFNAKENLMHEELEIKERRTFLSNTLQQVGFVPYQYEWWHFDIGDIFWSRTTGNPEVFGPLFGDNEWPF